jgi:hypothetical protein
MVSHTSASKDRLLVVRWLAIAGVLVAIVWAFAGYLMLHSRLGGLQRAGVPGQMVINVPDAEGLTVFYEDPTGPGGFLVHAGSTNTLTNPPVDVTITGPSGQPIPTASYQRDLRFTHDGRTVTAVATFQAPTAGAYTLQTTGEVPPAAQVSVGHVIDVGLLASTAAAIGLFVAALLVLVVTALIRASTRPRRTSEAGPENLEVAGRR